MRKRQNSYTFLEQHRLVEYDNIYHKNNFPAEDSVFLFWYHQGSVTHLCPGSFAVHAWECEYICARPVYVRTQFKILYPYQQYFEVQWNMIFWVIMFWKGSKIANKQVSWNLVSWIKNINAILFTVLQNFKYCC